MASTARGVPARFTRAAVPTQRVRERAVTDAGPVPADLALVVRPSRPEPEPTRSLLDRLIGNGLVWAVVFTVVALALATLIALGLTLGDVWVWTEHLATDRLIGTGR